jgi:hypothetical protein
VVLLLRRALVSWSLAIDEHIGYKDLCSSGRQSVIPYVYGRTGLYCSSLPCLCESEPFFSDPDRSTDRSINLCEVAPAQAFYSSRSGSYNESRGPIGGLGAGQTVCCRSPRQGVANDVFNDVGMPGLVAYHPALGQWYGVVLLHH